MDHRYTAAVLLALLQVFNVNGETCHTYDWWGYTSQTFYCNYGCCGSSSSQYCCTSDYTDYTNYNGYISTYKTTSIWSIGTIVGIAVGSIAGLGLLVAAIVLICKKCVAKNRVIHMGPTQPHGAPAMTQSSGMVTQGGTAAAMPPPNTVYGY